MYSGKKVYCNCVYHNDKFHGSTAAHPRNEYRIYLNKALENDQLYFRTDDIMIMRSEEICNEDNELQTVYLMDLIRDHASPEYAQLNDVISNYPIRGGYGIFDGFLPYFERQVEALQLKRGLGKEYVPQTEPLASLRGKIDMGESIKTQSMLRKQLVCTYDDFTVNCYMNRILKSTMELLVRSDITKARKKELRKLLVFFGEVEPLNVYDINWQLQYNRNNQSYRMLVSICHLVVKGLLQSNTSGGTKLMDFLDEQRMCRLYEKFILEYYRKEHPEIKASASQIP